MNLKDMKIVTKISLIIAAFSLLAATLIAVSALGITSNQKRVSAVLDDQEQSLYLGALAAEKKTRIHQEAFEIALEADPAHWARLQTGFETEMTDLNKLLKELRPLMDGEDLLNYQRVETAKGRYAELEQTLSKLRSAGDAAGAETLVQGEMSEVFKTMDDAFDKLIAKQDHDMDQASLDIAAASRHTLIQMVLVGVLGLVAAISGGIALATLQIARPVTGLTDAMSKLARGDLTTVIPGLGRRDEVGRMAEALGVFKDAALAKVQLERDAAVQRTAAEAERSANDNARAASAQAQKTVVDGLAEGLGRLAEGDLLFRLTQAFPPEYEQLRADFNGAIGKLQDTIGTVASGAAAIRSGAGEIASASDDLSRRTEQQAASLEETAAALDQITATVKRTAEGSTRAREVVGDARVDADRSREIVQRAVGAMGGIEESSRHIGQIISVIDEIAFQTNLLALNAGVEAARAGDAGRGFAVVASEVRALAQRSAGAAKEIKALIRNAETQVADGVDMVRTAGEALERIMDKVQQINTVVSEIAVSAQEQALGLSQVNTAVNQMDQVTQQNAAMVEQATAASRSLTQEAEELFRRIATFKVDGQPQTQTRRPPTPARVQMKTLGRRGAAAAPVEADWEEF